eukprot:6490009-Amphidinium_carterae.1
MSGSAEDHLHRPWEVENSEFPWETKPKKRRILVEEEEGVDVDGEGPEACAFWQSDGEEEKEQEEEIVGEVAEQKLLEFLLAQHMEKHIPATTFGRIAFYASRAGSKSFEKFATPDGSSSGNYQKKIDKALGYADQQLTLYEVPIPAFLKQTQSRGTFNLPCMLPHELIESDMVRAGLVTGTDVKRSLSAKMHDLPPNYWSDPLHLVAGPPIIPLGLFVDGVQFSKGQSLIVFCLLNLLTGSKLLITTVRKSLGCHCGCLGWCSLASVYSWLLWAFESFKSGVYPLAQHTGEEFPEHSMRAERRGQQMQLRG